MTRIARPGRRAPDAPLLGSVPLRAAAAVVAVVLALLAARCVASSNGGAPSDNEARAGATATLAARAVAVTGHDKAAYLATDAPGWFRDADGQRFDDLAGLPIAEWSMQLADTQPAALAHAGVPHVYQVTETYELSGVDYQPVTVTRYLTFVQHSGKWLLSSDRDGAAAGLRADTQIWDQGPVSAVQGSRSLVIGPGGAQRLKPFADLADHAADKAAKVWGGAGWGGDVVVLVPETQGQVETLLNAAPGSLQGVVAITAGEGGKPLTGAPASRVLINPDAFNGEAPDAWQFFLDHELTHVATRAWTTAAVPLWLSEGAADYTGYLSSAISSERKFQELADAVGAGWKPEELPTSDDFRGSGDAVSRTYQISHLACSYIATTYGQAKLVAFYQAVGTAPAGTADPVDEAFRTVLGTTAKDFTVKWRAAVLAKGTAVEALLKKKS